MTGRILVKQIHEHPGCRLREPLDATSTAEAFRRRLLESLDDDEVNASSHEFWPNFHSLCPNPNELGANVDKLDANLSKLLNVCVGFDVRDKPYYMTGQCIDKLEQMAVYRKQTFRHLGLAQWDLVARPSGLVCPARLVRTP
ncbi:hypothetical protein K523DRAFT_354519 [Schizophyllum commune Tattone D]|nr:hypothetical protein K523DRAFT_354519 [Schizophyllum commune Tattone D]